MPLWLNQKLHLPREIRRELDGGYTRRIVFTEHHESHAASAFYPSPFDDAAIMTLDGVGEWATASFGIGRGNRIELSHELRFPAQPRSALLGLHLLHRIQGQLGRVQAHGSRALW